MHNNRPRFPYARGGASTSGGTNFQPNNLYPPQNPNPQFYQPPSFQNPNPFLHHQAAPYNAHDFLQWAETASLKAHGDLVAARGPVSAWSVSEAALAELGVHSWADLGLLIQHVPTLHRLMVLEGKVNAFIHCFVGVRRIASLYDLEVAICKNEGVEKFEVLGLGPLPRLQLIEHYFSIPSDQNEVFRITMEEILSSLHSFMDIGKKNVTPEEFLIFLSKKKSVLVKEKLGVRIESLGLYISYILEAQKSEKAIISKYLDSVKRIAEKRERNSVFPEYSYPNNLLKNNKINNLEQGHALNLHSRSIESFSTTWKDVSQLHSVSEILEMMLKFYLPSEKRRNKIRRMFLTNPGLGLVNVAVTSIRCGLLDSLCHTFQGLQGSQLQFPDSIPTAMIDVGPVSDEHTQSITRQDIGGPQKSITTDDIIKKLCDYCQLQNLREGNSSDSMLNSYRKLYYCEEWLLAQFSVTDFSLLGNGNFFEFLTSHASLLPHDLGNLIGLKHSVPSLVVSLLHHQVGVLLSQADYNRIDNNALNIKDFSDILKKQFPSMTCRIAGFEPDKCLSDIIQKHKDSDQLSSIIFSSCLLGKQLPPKYRNSKEKYVSESAGRMGQETYTFNPISSKDALECLLKSPMLSDLVSWSHWNAVYAPTFGPLPEWLLGQTHAVELLCIATVDGKLIRVDPSGTVDGFLEALIQCSSFQVATRLLSLLCLYRGTKHAPISLLRSYVKRAIDVMIRNFTDSAVVMNKEAKHNMTLQDKSDSCEDFSGCTLLTDFQATTDMPKTLHRINKAIPSIARFFIEILCHIPAEFRCFTADILMSGFQSFTKQAPFVMLNECSQLDERLMLHDIGLCLGVAEWIQDYHDFCSGAHTNLSPSQVTSYSSCANPSRKLQQSLDESVELSSNDCKVQVGLSHNSSLSCDINKPPGEATEVEYNNATCDFAEISNDIMGKQVATNVKDGSASLKSEMIEYANMIIEAIRREEFGLEQGLVDTESQLLRKQHARLGRALHCLSLELYSQDSHLLLELVQNADDNVYPLSVDPTLIFILQESGIVVLNNEEGFSANNIRALCDIGNSTKKGSGAGYIGHKGIGFKSVFRVSDAPEIHSNGFHIKFDITEGEIGFVLPTLTSPCDIEMYRHLLCSQEDLQTDSQFWNTCIVLPFKSKFREGTSMSSIISMFDDLHPSLLLFLHRLQCIKFKNMLNGTYIHMKREIMDDGIVKVSLGKETLSWLVASKQLRVSVVRRDVETTEIAIAFTLQVSDGGEYKPYLSQQPVFAFLPVRNYGLKFILQGDFVLPSSREEVDADCDWNQWLLSEFPALFVAAEKSFCSLPCFQNNPGKAVTAYMSFIPMIGEVHGFFSPLPHMIISQLRVSKCLLLDGQNTEWVFPCRVLSGCNDQARLLLSDNLLQKHLGLGYLSSDIILSESLAKALGVQEYGLKVLIDVISSVCQDDGSIQSLGLEWLSSWLVALYSALLARSSAKYSAESGIESDLMERLKTIPFIPLSNGSYSSISDGPIWLPRDVKNTGFDGKHSQKDFPTIYSKLRIVNPLVFCPRDASNYSVEEPRADEIVHVLNKVGVQPLSSHEIIKSHVLTALSNVKVTTGDMSWMVEYLSFIMVHFQFACALCNFEKTAVISQLRGLCILCTNYGYKSPTDEPIHFGKEYGNSIDKCKLIGNLDIKWLEVDAVYLNHPSTKHLSSASKKWREFLQELGVTDFVQVKQVQKHTLDTQVSENSVCFGDNIGRVQIDDWESTEMVMILSSFSSKNCREQCIYFLEVLDKFWDDCYNSKANCLVSSLSSGQKKHVLSSFVNSIRSLKWVASCMDQELHHSKDLFYNGHEIRSVLGTMAPYAIPQLTSKLLLNNIGFKTQLLHEDVLKILHQWSMSGKPFLASLSQMSNCYTFISNGVSTSQVKITNDFMACSFIFVPFLKSFRHDDLTSGVFRSPKDAFWKEPTGCLDMVKKMLLQDISSEHSDPLLCQSLSTAYPGLHDFFVNICGVPEVLPFGSYLTLMLQLARVALPSQASYLVFRVLLRWSEDLKSGIVKNEDILSLKENLYKLENKVLPTLHDKWVSLHASFGLVCWADDGELKQQFKHSHGVHILDFGELSSDEIDMLSGKVSELLHNIGVPTIYEVTSREPIFYGTRENTEKMSLVNWALPYAQRYIFNLHVDTYLKLKRHGFEKISDLKVVVVGKLYYKYKIKGHGAASKKRYECNCLLQGNVLYAISTVDAHSVFLELSRFFFNGSTNLHLANFLHMVTTMAESGSTTEQTNFFIVNSQKIPMLPDDESLWFLSNLSESAGTNIKEPVNMASATAEKSMTKSQKKPATAEKSITKSQMKPSIYPSWTPTVWRSAPDWSYYRSSHAWLAQGLVSYGSSSIESNKPLESVSLLEALPVPVEIDELFAEEGLTSTSSTVLADSEIVMDQVCLDDSSEFLTLNICSEEEYAHPIVPGSRMSSNTTPASIQSEELQLKTSDDPKAQLTGRLGEAVAYKYFTQKLGSDKVKWVNKESETGLPYDIIIGENGANEFIEVKATKYASKNWFHISFREWQFAAEMGESYSIAHVTLSGEEKADISVLKNPLKLCQQSSLRLALFMVNKTLIP